MKDYFSKMQGQGKQKPAPAPAPEKGAPAPGPGPTADHGNPMLEGEEADLNPDNMRQRIMQMLEEAGIMQEVSSEEEQNEIMALVDQLVEDIIAGDQAAVEENPILELLASTVEGMAAEEEPQAPMPGMGEDM